MSFDLHLRSVHLIHKLEFTFSNLNDFLNKAIANLLLNIRDPVQFISLPSV